MGTSRATSLGDAALVAKARGLGDEGQEALGELLGRHARGLHRYFAVHFRDAELAMELVQEVFERVILARERMPEGEGFRHWLWEIAVNVGRGVRRRARAAPPLSSLEEVVAPGISPLVERLAGNTPSPSREAAGRERSERLREALGELDEDLQSVLHLKFFQEKPCREVAAILEIPEGTVWSRTHRALERRREIVASELRPGEEETR